MRVLTRRRLLLTVCMLIAVVLAQAGVNVTTYNLENIRVRAFIKDVTYKAGDGTRVGNYDVSPPERRDQPAPATPEWKPVSNAVSQQLIVSTSAVFANADTFALSGAAGSCEIYNLIPNKTYYYKVLALDADGQQTEIVNSSFATEGTVRMIKADSGYNIRDIGGWPTRSGHSIRYGMIYRGAEWDGKYVLTSADSALLHDLGIRAELDLRNNSEANYVTVSRIGTDVEYKRIPTVTYYMEGISAYNPRFREQLQFVFDKVKAGQPVYFHCHIGADRTGCLGFLIEGLLGVSESNIYKEYELTTFSALRTGRYKGGIEEMMAFIKTFDGSNLEEQFFSYCTQGLGLNPKDIVEFKSTMLQYPFINTIDFGGDTITVNVGEQIALTPSLLPENASRLNLSYTIDDPQVATITARGNLTGVRGGTAIVTAKAGVISQQVVVSVPCEESQMPQWITYEGYDYQVVGHNLVSNGSFEYAHPFTGWTTGIESELSADNFALKEGTPCGDKYLQSLYSAEEESPRSLKALWKIEPDKTYVFGYKVRNSKGNTITANPCLITRLINIKPSNFTGNGDDFIWDDEEAAAPQPQIIVGDDDDDQLTFAYPSYSGQWTDVQYVFTNTAGYDYCQIVFYNLSDERGHTCFDNFFLAELSEGEPTAVTAQAAQHGIGGDTPIYSIDGTRIDTKPAHGIYIKNGKTYKAQ